MYYPYQTLRSTRELYIDDFLLSPPPPSILLWLTPWVQQRLIRLDIVAHSVTGEQLAQVLHSALTDFAVHGSCLLGCTRDGASVNGAALERLKIFYPKMLEVTCVSHTFDNVGSHFEAPAEHWKSSANGGSPSFPTARKQNFAGRNRLARE